MPLVMWVPFDLMDLMLMLMDLMLRADLMLMDLMLRLKGLEVLSAIKDRFL